VSPTRHVWHLSAIVVIERQRQTERFRKRQAERKRVGRRDSQLDRKIERKKETQT
jgi:hypothetical protein